MFVSLPVVDISPLLHGDGAARGQVASEIAAACRDSGFFYAVGHGVAPELFARVMAASREFFALPLAQRMEIAMAHGGRAWRGYFPVGEELTSGRPDRKEGLYFGTELADDHPRVRAGVPLHGANLFPAQVPGMRRAVLEVMFALTAVGHRLMEGVALALGLDGGYFSRHYTADPTVLFRIFHYPPGDEADWGVGEHTDYGLLTLLVQDEVGGLEVRTPRGWIAAPPISGALVCNIGDMLDRLSGGEFRSTPHRVRNTSGRSRLSLPLFFDPDFDAQVRPLPARVAIDDDASRWDGRSVHVFDGTYGEYLEGKISRVFPALFGEISSSTRRGASSAAP